MNIGILKEIKLQEYRVGLTPSSVKTLVARGHSVIVESNAGAGIGMSDALYQAAGAKVVSTNDEVFEAAELLVKVKEPQPEECKKLKENQVLFTFLHLAPDPVQTELLMASGATAIAYETVTDNFGRLPLLAPMSEVAGRLAVQAGASCLEAVSGGKGMLLAGVPGVQPANVVVIGGGVVGSNALKIAVGMGANVTVLDKSVQRLREIEDQFGWQVSIQFASDDAIEKAVVSADLVIGAVLIPGAAAPKLVSEEMIKAMEPGSVVVDVAIDQGGCFATSRVTNYESPTFNQHNVIHYCVANMPGGVPRTATFALNNATLPYVLELADKGYKTACLENPHLMNGINVVRGNITQAAVAKAQNLNYQAARDILLSS